MQHEGPGAFLERAEAWLLAREDASNFVLSVAYLLRRGAPPFVNPAYLATIETGTEADTGVAGVVMCPPPDGVYLTDIPLDAIPSLVEQLRGFTDSVPEALGPEPATVEFARCWGRRWRRHSRLRRYKLEAVVPPEKPATGRLRLAAEADLDYLGGWAEDYGAEMDSKVDTVAFFRALVDRKSLYLWDDRGPRAVVTVSGLTPNGARVSSVYTPPQFRGSGYARSAVAAASQTILDGGRQFAMIAADVDDPVPNAIYRSLGYRPVDECVLIHID